MKRTFLCLVITGVIERSLLYVKIKGNNALFAGGDTIMELEDSLLIDQQQKNKFIVEIFKNIIAILFWIYVISKLFFFDIDHFIMGKLFPRYEGLLDFKFFILMGVLAVIWLFTRNKNIILWSLYILLFPFIVFLWKFPFLVFKNQSWNLAFAVISFLLSVFISLKYKFILTTLFLISAVLIITFSINIIVLSAAFVIFVILIMVYFHQSVAIFKSSSVIKFYFALLAKLDERKGLSLLELDEDIKKLPINKLNEKQLEKRTTNLQNAVLYNRILLFFASKLKDYRNNKINYVFYILNIIILVVITIISFSLINHALFKYNTDFFSYNELPNFFAFFAYTFSNIIPTSSISSIVAELPLSKIVSMVTSMSGFYIAGIFIALMLSVKSEKNEDQLTEVITGFEEQGAVFEDFIYDEYKINGIEDALQELDKVKSVFIKFLYRITDNIK